MGLKRSFRLTATLIKFMRSKGYIESSIDMISINMRGATALTGAGNGRLRSMGRRENLKKTLENFV